MGIGRLTPDVLPTWPTDPEDAEAWPKDDATGQRLVRFDWDSAPTDPDNWPGIQAIVNYIRTKGGERAPTAIPALRVITAEDLESQVIGKYKNHLPLLEGETDVAKVLVGMMRVNVLLVREVIARQTVTTTEPRIMACKIR